MTPGSIFLYICLTVLGLVGYTYSSCLSRIPCKDPRLCCGCPNMFRKWGTGGGYTYPLYAIYKSSACREESCLNAGCINIANKIRVEETERNPNADRPRVKPTGKPKEDKPKKQKSTKKPEEPNEVEEKPTTLPPPEDEFAGCAPLPLPGGAKGVKMPEMYEHGAQVTFECKKKFNLQGSATRTCINGSWDGELTVCAKKPKKKKDKGKKGKNKNKEDKKDKKRRKKEEDNKV